MKVFKMLHLNILDGAIVRDMGTFHGINKCPPVAGHMVCDDLLDQQLDINPKNENISILDMTTTISQVKYVHLGEFIVQVFHDIKTIAIEIPTLQPHLLLGLKVLRSKQQDMIPKGIVGLEHSDVNLLFPFAPGDNTLRQHRGILKPHVQKQNHLKDKAIKHMCIQMLRESKIPNVGMYRLLILCVPTLKFSFRPYFLFLFMYCSLELHTIAWVF
jgi:hypothetical protein